VFRRLFKPKRFVVFLLVAILLLVVAGCDEADEDMESLPEETQGVELKEQTAEQLEVLLDGEAEKDNSGDPAAKGDENVIVTLKYFISGREYQL
jgi:hypothetical protein